MTNANIRRVAIAALELVCLVVWLAVLFALTLWT